MMWSIPSVAKICWQRNQNYGLAMLVELGNWLSSNQQILLCYGDTKSYYVEPRSCFGFHPSGTCLGVKVLTAHERQFWFCPHTACRLSVFVSLLQYVIVFRCSAFFSAFCQRHQSPQSLWRGFSFVDMEWKKVDMILPFMVWRSVPTSVGDA